MPAGYAVAPAEKRFGLGEFVADLLWKRDPPLPEAPATACVRPSDCCVGTVPSELSLRGPGGAGAAREGSRGEGVLKSCAATLGEPRNAEGAWPRPADEG